ncbi:CPCC family cysteine-rich protein [Ureibacillus sp. FSL E2-3493]|uniref:CPCC family cysteine-rich protein n=1 Tax=Ureibacillus sp. FSL E2-3493 TaxID=2921367 RepID=UPI00311A629A
MKYTCPCCGYKTLDEQPPGTYDICRICYWEDDGIQYDDPDYEGGANIPSLRQAQKNFIEFGACEERCIEFVRKPNEQDEKDVHWKRLV